MTNDGFSSLKDFHHLRIVKCGQKEGGVRAVLLGVSDHRTAIHNGGMAGSEGPFPKLAQADKERKGD